MRLTSCFCALIAGLLIVPTLSAADKAETKEHETPKIQIALLLDTSGSMQGLIGQAQQQLWKIVNEFATSKRQGVDPEFQVALYEYGKSSLAAKDGYLRQILPLTDDLDKVSEELFALKTNGGEEYCGQVIMSAATDLKWSKSDRDLKCIFIAGNEPFTQGTIDYRDACKKAITSGITVNTIFCGPGQEGTRTGWTDGAQLADGSYLNIDHNQKVAVVNAPQDEKLAKLNAKINTTYLAFGKKESRDKRRNRQAEADSAAEANGRGVLAERAVAKAGKFYQNSTWDLVDAIQNGKVKLKDLKDEELPAEIAKLKPEKREAFIKAKAAERTKIQEEIKQLASERAKYVTKVQSEQGNTLDAAIIKVVRDQATKKKYTFEDVTKNENKK